MAGSDAVVERLFIAVPLTEQARSKIADGLPPLPGRLVSSYNWHFTLRFLGNTAAPLRDALIGSLRDARLGKKFSIRFGGLGAFPRAKRARIIWLGLTAGVRELTSLADAVEAAARRAGFPKETRPFKPHLTLSRIEPPHGVTDILAAQSALDVAMPVTEVALVRSSLGSGPAKYEVIHGFPLEG